MKRRNNQLAKKLAEEGEKRLQEEFDQLVEKGTYKKNEYNKFIVCKFCNDKDSCTQECSIRKKLNNKRFLFLLLFFIDF